MVFSETNANNILAKIKNNSTIFPSISTNSEETDRAEESNFLCPNSLFLKEIFYKTFMSQINDKKVVGKGSFGRVLLHEMSDKEFAVKICSRSSCQCLGERNALLMKHPNVVKIYSILEFECIDFEKDIVNYIASVGLPLDIFKRFGAQIVVMELAGRQTLQQLLDDSEQEISTERRNHLINQIAYGIRYCHDSKVIHLDIKPANIMVMSGDICKIVDFGSSKSADNEHECNQEFTLGKCPPMGTVIYCAPEIFSNKLITPKADVYSFGITMWQILTRVIPFNDFESHSVIYRVVSGKLRPSLDEINFYDHNNDYINDYINLMVNCWNHDYNKRPNSTEICKKLSQFKTI